jgi:hypothetical protein
MLTTMETSLCAAALCAALLAAGSAPDAPLAALAQKLSVPGRKGGVLPVAGGHAFPVDFIRPLPNAASGRPRFYAGGSAWGPAGGTAPAQISVWEWDGERLVELLAADYRISLDTPGAIRFDGEVLHVPTKEPLETLSTCGACPDPIGEETIRVGAAGVVDLGHRFEDPELALADALFGRVLKKKPADAIAAPAVVKVLARELDGRPGLLGRWRVDRRENGSTLCLRFVDGPGPYELRLERRGPGWFFRSLARAADCR